METLDPAVRPVRPRLPLYAQVLLWFFVNLAVVALALALLLRAQLNPGLESLLSARAGERLGALGRAVAGELRNAQRESWNEILDRFGEAYGVTLMLCGPAGERIAGPFDPPPPKVMNHLRHAPPLMPPGRRPGPDGPALDRPTEDRPRFLHPPGILNPPPFSDPAAAPPHPEFRRPAARPLFFTRDGSPPKYWAGVHVSLGSMSSRPPLAGVLLVVSPNLSAGGLFLDPLPWVLGVGGVVLLSALIWAPFVRRVTRRLQEMTSAAECIAQGRFDIAIPAGSADELARLADSINRMAARLGHLVNGQRRFLGDIAHELCSPLARARIALGVLAQDSTADAGRMSDVEEELEQLSGLVHELLSFSKASLAARAVPAGPVPLLPLVEEVVRREARGCDARIEVPDGFTVTANREMLGRALANVVRNAARYAAPHGPLTIRADLHGSTAVLRVLDEGPGLPADMLERVFEPFFRPEEARTRETGGTGLGLAIARTCLGAFDATILCSNRQPRGLEVVIQLDASSAENTQSPAPPS